MLKEIKIEHGDLVYNVRTHQIGTVITESYENKYDNKEYVISGTYNTEPDVFPEHEIISYKQIRDILQNSVNLLHAVEKLNDRYNNNIPLSQIIKWSEGLL